MSNEPQDPDNAHVGEPGSEPEEQTPVGDEAEESPFVDNDIAQSGDDIPPEPESETGLAAEFETEPESETGSAAEFETEPESETGSAAEFETEPESQTERPEFDTGSDGLGFEPPPPHAGPIYQAPPPVRRLTRDPYSRLGGVASGIAHYYGIDVSLVRLAIVAFAVLTGIGFLLYFVAWLVIPRADVWPPPPPPGGYRGGRMDNRQLALGLIALGLLVAVFAGGGAGARVLIALGLVAGGIWIFNQRPAPTAMPVAGPGPEPVPPAQSGTAVGVSSSPAPSQTVATQWPTQGTDTSGRGATDSTAQWSSDTTAGQTGFESPSSGATAGSGGYGSPGYGAGGYEPPNQTYYQATAYPPPQPVPARRRRIWPFVLIGVLLVAPILAIGGAIAAFVALEGGDVSISTDGTGQYRVDANSPAEIPNRIREGTGELEIDFTDLDLEDFADQDVPIPVEVDLTAGQIVIELPEDLPVDVTADIGAAGEIQVFDNTRQGFRPGYSVSEPDAVLELDVHLGAGEILIER